VQRSPKCHNSQIIQGLKHLITKSLLISTIFSKYIINSIAQSSLYIHRQSKSFIAKIQTNQLVHAANRKDTSTAQNQTSSLKIIIDLTTSKARLFSSALQ